MFRLDLEVHCGIPCIDFFNRFLAMTLKEMELIINVVDIIRFDLTLGFGTLGCSTLVI